MREEESKGRTEREDEVNKMRKELSCKGEEIRQMSNTLEYLQGKLQKAEELRSKMHEYTQTLKGNIRVYCRVKPMIVFKYYIYIYI